MNGMIDYIFSSLKTSERAITNINRTLFAQNKLNNVVTVFAIVTLVNIAVMKKRIREQDEKINKLTKENEELNPEKGE